MGLKRRSRPTPAASTPVTDEEMQEVALVLANYTPDKLPFFGAPTRCPECRDYGMVDSVEHGVCRNHCSICNREWTITARALRAFRQSPAGQPLVPAAPAVPKVGALAAALARQAERGGSPPPRPEPRPAATPPVVAQAQLGIQLA